MRGRHSIVVLVVLALAALLPGAAFADPPVNDSVGGAQVLNSVFSPSSLPTTIPPTSGSGGWTDATATDDLDTALPPSCLGAVGFHSMWYQLRVAEASVLTVSLRSSAVDRYQPVVTIINATSKRELACGLGGADTRTDPGAFASSYVPADLYLIRIASVQNSVTGSTIELPSLTLTESLRDVTPPQIQVSVSGKAKIVGIGKTYTFNAAGSKDLGSGVDPSSAVWEFYDNGKNTQVSATGSSTPLIATHRWETAGLHRVTLQLADGNGNKNTYSFNILVHNFVPPQVSLSVFIPSPGSRRLRVTLKHDVPIRIRLVVMQNGKVLRVISSKLLKGSHTTTSLGLALTRAVGTPGFVVVSGVASDVGQFPNTVPLLTCEVDPVNGGGKCA